MEYTYPGPVVDVPAVVAAVVVIGAWLVVSVAGGSQRSFWNVTVGGWVACALASGMGLVPESIGLATRVGLLLGWLGALVVLVPLSLVAPLRRRR